MVYMLCIFGYMSFCVVVKWLTKFDNPSEAPSIIALMINFASGVDHPLYMTNYK